MIAEGNETPGGQEPPGSEGDLLAERRARRAAESGEHALSRRAQDAEATVRTLEAHVASLQQRLRETGEERQRVSELIASEPTPPADERELRRATQREYAEQQLRIEAEERCAALERESRAEVERLKARLNASERDAHAIAKRLETVQRELAEVEQMAAAERVSMRRAEHALQGRLTELERRAVEINRGLDAERAAREHAERMLESMRRGQRTLEGLVDELRELLAGLKRAAAASAGPAPVQPARAPAAAELGQPAPVSRGAQSESDRAEMADALAAAVARLRARADEQLAPPFSEADQPLGQHPLQRGEQPLEQVEQPPQHGGPGEQRPQQGERSRPPVEQSPLPVEQSPKPAERPEPRVEQPAEPVAKPPAHKHSMSLIKRWRLALRRRRERRRRERTDG